MYNDFVMVGPKSDPAGVKGKDIVAALKKIAAANAPFISRGDKSGTHAAERRATGRRPACRPGTVPNERRAAATRNAAAAWARRSTSAASSDAYVLTDRGTWLSFKNRADLAVLVEGDKRLFNQYGVMVVSPSEVSAAQSRRRAEVRRLGDLAGGAGRIASYKIDGEQLFFPERSELSSRLTDPSAGTGFP